MSQENSKEFKVGDFLVSQDRIQKWQEILALASRLFQVPVALIMKVHEKEIEVFLSSQTEGNPYKIGEKANLGTGLYCEKVLKTNKQLMVPNALLDEEWKNNPDIKLDMIFYLGLPVRFPDGSNFGTICILDKKQRDYQPLYQELFQQFRDFIEDELGLLYYLNKQELTIREMSRINALMIDREQRIIELKKEVNAALVAAGKSPQYSV